MLVASTLPEALRQAQAIHLNSPNSVSSIFISPAVASLKGSLGKVCARLPVPGRGEAASGPGVPLMSRDQLSRRCRRLLDRLNQPSSAANLAALLALLLPQLAEHAPVLVDLTLTVIAIGAAIVAMVKCECRDCNGR
jgi:hypothetical protein